MTARSIGDILHNVAPSKRQRTFQPVRRSSFHRGEREEHVWRRFAGSKAQARQLVALRMKAAENYDRRGKQPGQRNGPLGHVAIEVLRALYSVIDYKSGRLDPSIDWICEKTKRARAAVVAAMARLKQHGFLDWIRRTEPVKNDGAGPQVRQITNAYWFSVPKAVAGWIASKLAPGPIPDDEAERLIAYERTIKYMLDAEGYEATARYAAHDPKMQEALVRLGRALDQSASSPSGQNPIPEVIRTR